MRARVSLSIPVVFAMIIIAAMSQSACGQSVWLPPYHGNAISLEIMKPDYSGDNHVTFLSSVLFLTGRYQASPSIAVIGELPLSYYERGSFVHPYWGVVSSFSETAAGNPYIGILHDGEYSSFVVEGGVRLPITKDDKYASLIHGWRTDFDRWTAFYPDLVTVRTRVGSRFTNSTGNVSGRLLAGGSLLIPTEAGDGELFAELTAEIWYGLGEQSRFGVDFSGHTLLTVDDADFTERSEFQIGLGLAGTFGSVQPGLHFQVPIGDEGFIHRGKIVEFVFGFNVTVLLSSSDDNEDSW